MRKFVLVGLLAGLFSLQAPAVAGLLPFMTELGPVAGTPGPTVPVAASPVLLARKGELSQGEAVQIAQSRHGGKAIKVERRGDVYWVRLLLPNGRVKEVAVPAGGRGGD